jgi:hypothetical protein
MKQINVQPATRIGVRPPEVTVVVELEDSHDRNLPCRGAVSFVSGQ